MIVGNSTKPVLDESSENFQSSIQLLNRNAGGYQGINAGYGSGIVTNNCIITQTVVGISPNINVSLTVNDTKITDCWFNGIYAFKNRDITINNSYIKDFGGAAIHVEDADSKLKTDLSNNVLEEIPNSTKITIDATSVLENYVSGDEGFFKAYSMEILVMQLKSQFEDGVKENYWTMIKKVTDPVTKLEYEKVNFIMLMVAIDENRAGDVIETDGSTYKIVGAGRNMMGLGFTTGDGTPIITDGLAGFNYMTSQNLTHTSTSVLNAVGGQDVVTLAGAMDNPYTFKGLLLASREVPGFGGSIIVAGVQGLFVE